MLCSWSFFALCEIWFKRFCFAASVAVTTEKLSRQDSFFRHDPPRNRLNPVPPPFPVHCKFPLRLQVCRVFALDIKTCQRTELTADRSNDIFVGYNSKEVKVLDKAKIQANQLHSKAVTDVELLDSLQWIPACYSTICKSTLERFGDAYHCHRRPSSPPWCRPSE